MFFPYSFPYNYYYPPERLFKQLFLRQPAGREKKGQYFRKTARSKGISKFRVTWKHQIRNAIMPVVTILGPTVAAVLTGTFVIESLFAIPGMGKYYVESVQNNDYSLILGMTAFYGTFLVFCNMVVDILYGVIDPRVRIGGK